MHNNEHIGTDMGVGGGNQLRDRNGEREGRREKGREEVRELASGGGREGKLSEPQVSRLTLYHLRKTAKGCRNHVLKYNA